jgi:hypothetical protein
MLKSMAPATNCWKMFDPFCGGVRRDVVHLGKPLEVQAFFRDILRGDTNPGGLKQPEPRRLGRWLHGHWPGRQAEKPCRACHGQPAQEASPRPACSLLETQRDLLSPSDRAQRDVGASVERVGRSVNHRARWHTPAAPTRSAALRMGVKDVRSSSLLVTRGMPDQTILHGSHFTRSREGRSR